ncbi:MAG: hypothetical protein ACLFQY_12955 [Desulfococcaceae bacterium]
MEPITVILSAIVGGAAAAGKDIGGKVVKDTYAGIKSLIAAKFTHQPEAQKTFRQIEQNPEDKTERQNLASQLKTIDAENDQELLTLAKSLLTELGRQGLLKTPDYQAVLSGSGAIAQGPDATAAGQGAHISKGGIHAKTIKADHVVDGVLMEGGDAETADSLLNLAKGLQTGGIHADDIQAKTIVTGLHYIHDPKTATPEDLHKEVAELENQIRQVIKTGEITDIGDAEDLEEAAAEAKKELARPQPRGSKIIRRLKTVTDILTQSAETAKAAGNLQTQAIKLAPTAALIYSIAAGLFGA